MVFEHTCIQIERIDLWSFITMVALYQQYQKNTKHAYVTLKSRLVLQGFVYMHIETAQQQLLQHSLI